MANVTIATNAPKSGHTPWRKFWYRPIYGGTHLTSSTITRSDGEKYIVADDGSGGAAQQDSGLHVRFKDPHNCGFMYRITIDVNGSDRRFTLVKHKEEEKDGASVLGDPVDTLYTTGTSAGDELWEMYDNLWTTIDLGVEVRFSAGGSQAQDFDDGERYDIRLPFKEDFERRKMYNGYSTWVRIPSIENTSFKSGVIPQNLLNKDLMVWLNPKIRDTNKLTDVKLSNTQCGYGLPDGISPGDTGLNLFMDWSVDATAPTDDLASSEVVNFTWPSTSEYWQLGTILLDDIDSNYPPIHIPFDDTEVSGAPRTGVIQQGNVDIAGRPGMARFKVDVYSNAAGTTNRHCDNTWWQLYLFSY